MKGLINPWSVSRQMAGLALAAFVMIALAACAERAEPGDELVEDTLATEPMVAGSSIADIVLTDGRFSTLAAALDSAGLAETLAGPGPYTVFAPTDEAFAALPEGELNNLLQPENREQLRSVLNYHVVSGEVTAADVSGMTGAAALSGDSLTISTSGGMVMINGATVTQPDIDANNGVIHVIDQVILPGEAGAM